MIYGYARVSTASQLKQGNGMEVQVNELLQAGAVEIYQEVYTGVKNYRPQLNALLEVLQPKDILMVTKLDRIARTARQGMELVDKLISDGITVHVLNVGVLDESPSGKLIRNVLFSFAEFERDMLISRTQEGLAIAKEKPGFKNGRPVVYTDEQMRHAAELIKNHSYLEVERMTKMSVSTLHRARRMNEAGVFDRPKEKDGKIPTRIIYSYGIG